MSAPRTPFRTRLGAIASTLAVTGALLAGVAGPAAAPVAAATPPSPTPPSLFSTGTGPTQPRSVRPDAAPTLAAGFTESPVFTGLTDPTVVRFAANGVVFVAQKSGRIVDYTSTASNTPHPFADLSAEVDDYWDRGLLGMALAPNFPTDPSVYVMYAYDHDPVSDLHNPAWDAPTQWNDACPSTPGATTDGCPIEGRIARLTAQSDGSGGYVSTGTETVLVTDDCQQFPSHSWATCIRPGWLPVRDHGRGLQLPEPRCRRSGLRPVRRHPHRLERQGRHAGQPVRRPARRGRHRPDGADGRGRRPAGPVRPPDGRPDAPERHTHAPPDERRRRTGNPFASSTDANAKRILAYGFRNPFRITFAPGSSTVWVGDVGYNSWEEVDRVSVPNVSGTANYGWPCVEGPDVDNYFTTAAPNLCSGIMADNTVDPYYVYSHGLEVVSGDGCSTSAGSVISAVGFYEGASYPAAYHGALFFGDHSRDCIWAMLPGSNGLPDPERRGQRR